LTTSNYILEDNKNINRDSRLGFFTGKSVSGGVCVRLCLGVTATGDRNNLRKSFDVGVSPFGKSGGISVTNGEYIGNPHRYVFGPTKLNGGK
jgi:hypothetical protein